MKTPARPGTNEPGVNGQGDEPRPGRCQRSVLCPRKRWVETCELKKPCPLDYLYWSDMRWQGGGAYQCLMVSCVAGHTGKTCGLHLCSFVSCEPVCLTEPANVMAVLQTNYEMWTWPWFMLQMTVENPGKWGKSVGFDQKHVTDKSRKVYILWKMEISSFRIYNYILFQTY